MRRPIASPSVPRGPPPGLARETARFRFDWTSPAEGRARTQGPASSRPPSGRDRSRHQIDPIEMQQVEAKESERKLLSQRFDLMNPSKSTHQLLKWPRTSGLVGRKDLAFDEKRRRG